MICLASLGEILGVFGAEHDTRRTPEEWAEGIQPNAKQINFLSLVDFLSEIDSLNKSDTYFLYCRSGKRSAQACMYMYDKGFTTYNLMGGMLSWDGEVVK